jgi:hypothetical protein
MTERIDIDGLVTKLNTAQRKSQVKSQKAAALLNIGSTPWAMLRTAPLLLDDEVRTVERGVFDSIMNSPVHAAFIRACPLTPRPGRLESSASTSVVESVNTFNRIRDIMEDIEPDGCMIVQPFIPATASAVLAPNKYIVIGPEHDGTTSGHGFQLTLKVQNEQDRGTYNFIDKVSKDNKHHELEFVWAAREDTDRPFSGDAYLVQVRACTEHDELGKCKVSVNGEGRFTGRFPKDWDGKACEASEVIMVTGTSDEDMAALEAALEANENKTLVVCEPTGSLLTHAGAQSRKHGVVFISETTIEAGDTIEVLSSFDNSPYESHFKRGIEYARRAWQQDWGWLSTFFRQFQGDPFNDARICAFLGGCYVGWMINAGVAAIIGEVRHARSTMRGYSGSIGGALAGLIGYSTPPDRRKTYYGSLLETSASYQDMIAVLEWAEHIYNHNWAGSSFGGKKWADCSQSVRSLTEAVMEGDFQGIIDAADATENKMHNCGWLFDKFVPKSALDYGTHGFRVHSSQISFSFGLHGLASSILTSFKDADFSINKVVERDAPSISWESITTADSDYDMDRAMKEMDSAWKAHREPDDGCPSGGCMWCLSTQPVVEEERTAPTTHTPQPMTILLHESTPPAQGWFAGQTPPSVLTQEIPNYVTAEHESTHYKGWLAGVALMVEHQIIDPEVASYIYAKISIEDNGLIEAWNTSLINCGAYTGDTQFGPSTWIPLEKCIAAYSEHHPPASGEVVSKYIEAYHHATHTKSTSDVYVVEEGHEISAPYVGMEIPSYVKSTAHEETVPVAIAGWSAGYALAMTTGFMDENLAAHILEHQHYIKPEYKEDLMGLCSEYGWDENNEPHYNILFIESTYDHDCGDLSPYEHSAKIYLDEYASVTGWEKPPTKAELDELFINVEQEGFDELADIISAGEEE